MTISDGLKALLANARPIEEEDTRYAALLSDLQCNILSGHGKQEALYFFLHFDDRTRARFVCGLLPRSNDERAIAFAMVDDSTPTNLPQATRASVIERETGSGPWLPSREECEQLRTIVLTSEKVVRSGNRESLAKRRANAAESADSDDPSAFVVNLFLSATGYEKLTDDPLPADVAFQQGMAQRKLNDPDPSTWDENISDADALLIVAYDPCSTPSARERQNAALDALGSVLKKYGMLRDEPQRGAQLTAKLGELAQSATAEDGAKDVAIEPFGFRDGISQPAFYQADIEELERRGVVRAAPPEGPDPDGTEVALARERAWQAAHAPLGLVLCPDPNGKTEHACGSYVVFRKLSQHIETFYAQVDRLVAFTERDEEDVLADLLGRRRDGTPLSQQRGAGTNTFDFAGDGEGKQCPFHAHIRKANPRGDIATRGREQRIVRRGMPYGPAIERDASGKPLRNSDKKLVRKGGGEVEAGDIGLLFSCAQADIEKQFERIQQDWLNNPLFAWGKLPGADPIAGQRATGEQNRIRIRRKDRHLPDYEAAGEPVVSLRGGAYFFAPSISFIRGLHEALQKTNADRRKTMSDINWDSQLSQLAGFIEPKDDPEKKPSATDKGTLLHLIWSLTYTRAGRQILKANRPNKAIPGTVTAVTPEVAKRNLKQWISDNFSILEESLVDAVVDAHLAADAWIAARTSNDTVEQARQQRIYQQNVSVVTWMLWEDAMAHEFSMNW